jgi:hypothetical protein
MPFGPHKGKRLLDLPAAYLLNLYDEGIDVDVSDHISEDVIRDLYAYIRASYDALEVENKNQQGDSCKTMRRWIAPASILRRQLRDGAAGHQVDAPAS